jgi:hypothetical protein
MGRVGSRLTIEAVEQRDVDVESVVVIRDAEIGARVGEQTFALPARTEKRRQGQNLDQCVEGVLVDRDLQLADDRPGVVPVRQQQVEGELRLASPRAAPAAGVVRAATISRST